MICFLFITVYCSDVAKIDEMRHDVDICCYFSIYRKI
jgi:hypothetical protein